MRVYDDICNLLNDELTEIVKKGELTSNALEIMDKAVDIVKDIKTIKAMEDGGYSEHYPYWDDMYDGGSYARGRGRNARHDSMGRYSRDEYSRADGNERMAEHLEDMMRSATTEQEKSMIRKWMEQIGR